MFYNKLLKLAFFLVFFIIASGHTMTLDPSIDTHLKNSSFSGTVLIARNQKIIHHHAYGMSDYESQTPNQTNTVFPIASITKPLTATLVMQLIEEGNLSLDSKLSKFLDHPFFIDPTLDDLLHHTSGLNLYSDFSKHDINRSHPLSKDAFYQLMVPTTKPDKSEFQYNNGNYMLLGQMIEAVSHKSYQNYFTQQLFLPIKMHHTHFIQQTQYNSSMALGYLKTKQGLDKAHSIHESWLGCGAGIASTALDLYQFMQSYLEEKILNTTSKKQMLAPTPYNYGLGWTLDNNTSAFYHEGGISGFSTMLFHVPDTKLTVVALANVEIDIEKITREIADLSAG